jgi:hypothetical protein
MSDANSRQVGGNHYAGEYQHWDFVEDVPLRYLPGQATKYVSRWRKKNGRQDLEKAIHFLDKCIERNTPAPKWESTIGARAPIGESPLERFLDSNEWITPPERQVITCITMGDYSRAKALIYEHLLPLTETAGA